MTLNKWFFALFVFIFTFSISGIAQAYFFDGAWKTTNGHIGISWPSGVNGELDVTIFDWNDDSRSIKIIDLNDREGYNPGEDTTFELEGDLTGQVDFKSDSNEPSNWFGLLFTSDEGGSTTSYDIVDTSAGSSGDAWKITASIGTATTSITFNASDVTPAPIPSTLVFLLAGVFGLIPFGRKIKPE